MKPRVSALSYMVAWGAGHLSARASILPRDAQQGRGKDFQEGHFTYEREVCDVWGRLGRVPQLCRV